MVDRAWLKANKDGSRDRRFKDNREILVISHGKLVFSAPPNVKEVYLVSNASKARQLSDAFARYIETRQSEG